VSGRGEVSHREVSLRWRRGKGERRRGDQLSSILRAGCVVLPRPTPATRCRCSLAGHERLPGFLPGWGFGEGPCSAFENRPHEPLLGPLLRERIRRPHFLPPQSNATSSIRHPPFSTNPLSPRASTIVVVPQRPTDHSLAPVPLPSPNRDPPNRSDGAQGREEAGGEEARGGGALIREGGEDARREEAQGGEAAAGVQVRWQGGRRQEGQEEGQEERRDVQDLHLQGAQAGAPRHWHLLQGHVHHELLHQRHLREARAGGRPPRPLQQEAHHHLPRDPDIGAPRPPRRARQARRLRGHQGRHQVHQQLSQRQFFSRVSPPHTCLHLFVSASAVRNAS
jgi:hypothetical protein